MSEKLTKEQEASEDFRHADELRDEAMDKWSGDLMLASGDLALRLAKIERYVGKLARPVGVDKP